ncbi:hypothetical protein RND81_08G096600 [Saponaria officinalis]|uniref:CRAL-TRIO domain-containing protein n=1 Tax=Saponaria officinalis TaxID=3572 RepID=A0AAW1J795_SAPOF
MEADASLEMLGKSRSRQLISYTMRNSNCVKLNLVLVASYQYFENIWNFLKAFEELKLPAFEALDLKRCLVVEKDEPIKSVSATSLFDSWASIPVAYGSIPVPQTFAVDFS